ncbi:hypothetical protein AMS68_005123 [Peltaster fructicola]|uniref:Triacylglycerol lipase n=1 Tax=Peltaster fructicola TaxID=286661 RepID=A0A6H0XY51_9PEZI|nr:hypothetical protein AMS68_005123 [Peltaster fructicola]
MVSLRWFAVAFILWPVVQAILITPAIDPFYQPPAGFASTAPGTILRSRPIVAANLGLIPIPVQATQLLYRTRSINGSAIATVTTIFQPLDAQPNRFISFQTAEDGAWINCAPSYNFQLLDPATNPIVAFELIIIQVYLASGYTVVSSDYEGPDAAFGAGRLSGYGTLDGMRAATQFLGGSQAIVGAGYSGGAIATGWAASLQPTYAPELDVKGWAMGGTPANLTGTALFVSDTLFSGFLPPTLDGLNKPSSYLAQLQPLINETITPYGQTILDIANTNCAPTDIVAYAGQSPLSFDFQSLGPALLQNPVFMSVLSQQTMGVNSNETPTAPVFLYHAVLDEIIPYANASTLFDSWCSKGAQVTFATFEAGGHFTTEIGGVVPSIQYAASAFAGTTPSACTTETMANPVVNPLALGLDAEPALVELLNTLIKLGPNDENLFNNFATTGSIAA